MNDLKSLVKSLDFRLVFVIAFALTLLVVAILHPYLYIFHAWRQGDVAAVARNFYTESMNIFYPRIDSRGSLTGINGMELPLYNYILAIIYTALHSTWLGFGKILSFAFGALSINYLYKIAAIDYKCKESLQLFLLIFISFTTPFFFFIATSVMPESLALSLALASFYYFYSAVFKKTSHINKSYVSKILLASICLAIAAMVRPYYIFFGLPYVLAFFIYLRCKPKLSVFVAIMGLLVLAPFFYWYKVWVPYLNDTYTTQVYFYMGSNLSHNLHNLLHSYAVLVTTLSSRFLLAYVYLPVLIYGAYVYFRRSKLLASLLSPLGMLIMIAILSGIVLPFIIADHYDPHFYFLGAMFPAIGLLVTVGISKIYNYGQHSDKKIILKIIYVFLVLTMLVVVYTKFLKLSPSARNARLLQQNKSEIFKGVPAGDLIVVADQGRSFIYYTGHKGWMIPYNYSYSPNYKKDEDIFASNLTKYKNLGARYVLFLPTWNGRKQGEYRLIKL